MTLAATSKSQLAYEAVRESIQNGRFGPGQRLVLEAIGNELGVSVVPVREAIRRLEAEGLVTFERNVGARVARIDPREFFVTVEALSYVEGAAISLGAKLVTPEAISEARSINAQMREMATSDHLDAQEFSRLNERFHRILSDSCPNAHLLDMVARGWTRLAHLRSSTFGFVPERALASTDEHDRIVQLIESDADAREIEMAVREHRLATPQAYLQKTHNESANRKEQS